jgi:hypothetical protein
LEDGPNGRELRDMLVRIDERLKTLEKQWGGTVRWLAGIAALVIGSIIVAFLRH